MLDDTKTPPDLFQELSANLHKEGFGAQITLLKQRLLLKIFGNLYQDIEQLAHESAGSFKEVRRSVLLFEAIEKEYGEKAKSKGADTVIQDIIDYAKNQTYDKEPLQVEVAQTALRALCEPAPIESEHPNYLLATAPNLFGAGKLFHAREMLCTFWLAACDPHIEANIAKEEANIAEKNLILRILAEIRRANNKSYFNSTEDDKVDKLSCGPGVITRLGNSFNHNEKLRALKQQLYCFIEDFPLKFNAFLITHFRTFSAIHQWHTILAYYQIIREDEVTFEEYNAFMHSFLSEKVFAQYVEMLQDEYGAFDENLFKYAISIYFEQWLKNKHNMSLDVFRNLEKSATEAICHATSQTSVESFSPLALETHLNKLQNILNQIEELQNKHRRLTNFDHNLLSHFHQTYSSLYQNFYTTVENVRNLIKQEAQAGLEIVAKQFQQITGTQSAFLPSSTPKVSLPFSVNKLLHKQSLLHQQMMELLYERVLSLYEYEPYPETLVNAMMLLGFEGQMLSFDQVRLVKAFLYRHSQTPEALGLEKYLSPRCCLDMRRVKENVRLYFTDLSSLTTTFYDLPTPDFDSMAKKEMDFQKSLSTKEVKQRSLLRLF